MGHKRSTWWLALFSFSARIWDSIPYSIIVLIYIKFGSLNTFTVFLLSPPIFFTKTQNNLVRCFPFNDDPTFCMTVDIRGTQTSINCNAVLQRFLWTQQIPSKSFPMKENYVKCSFKCFKCIAKASSIIIIAYILCIII